jgi:hypothetical protein
VLLWCRFDSQNGTVSHRMAHGRNEDRPIESRLWQCVAELCRLAQVLLAEPQSDALPLSYAHRRLLNRIQQVLALDVCGLSHKRGKEGDADHTGWNNSRQFVATRATGGGREERKHDNVPE